MPITTLDDLNRNPFIQGELFEVTLGPKGQAELPRYVSGVFVVGSEHPVAVGIKSARQGKTLLTFTPLWERIQRVDITTTTDTFDFDTVNGDDDCEYKIEGYWVMTGNVASNLSLRVNESTGGLSLDGSVRDGYGTTGSSSQMLVAYKTSGSVPAELYFETTFYAKSGSNRLGKSLVAETDGTTAAATEIQMIAMKAEDTSTVITKLGLDSSAGTYIGEGSWFQLYRRPEFDNTKIKIWVF